MTNTAPGSGCAACSDADPADDASRSAGAAAADAVFRQLDASLDEDDDDIFKVQGENRCCISLP